MELLQLHLRSFLFCYHHFFLGRDGKGSDGNSILLETHYLFFLNWYIVYTTVMYEVNGNFFMIFHDRFAYFPSMNTGSSKRILTFNMLCFPTDDTAILWGIKFYNDLLMQAGPLGNVQSEILLRKDASFTFEKGWAFPRRVYFNGDNCVMPAPDAYPWLPNASSRKHISLLTLMIITFLSALTFTNAYL